MVGLLLVGENLEGGENGAVLAAQVAQFLVVIALVFLDLAFARGDCRLDPRQLGGFFLGRLALASGCKMTAHPIGIRPGNLRLGISPAILAGGFGDGRSEGHTSELQSLMRISYDVFCLTKTRNK